MRRSVGVRGVKVYTAHDGTVRYFPAHRPENFRIEDVNEAEEEAAEEQEQQEHKQQ